MRDNRFVAKNLGGGLSIENHKLLMQWAIGCVERAIEVANLTDIYERAKGAIKIVREWEKGSASLNDARQASLSAHDAARECVVEPTKAIIRACGHTVATAHMADHSLRAMEYIIRGLGSILSKEDLENEKRWQIENADILIQEMITKKAA